MWALGFGLGLGLGLGFGFGLGFEFGFGFGLGFLRLRQRAAAWLRPCATCSEARMPQPHCYPSVIFSVIIGIYWWSRWQKPNPSVSHSQTRLPAFAIAAAGPNPTGLAPQLPPSALPAAGESGMRDGTAFESANPNPNPNPVQTLTLTESANTRRR